MSEWTEREEFGLGLFEVTSVIGAILQLREYQRLSTTGVTAAARDGWRTREQELVRRLPALITALPDAQALRIVEQYPWVTSC